MICQVTLCWVIRLHMLPPWWPPETCIQDSSCSAFFTIKIVCICWVLGCFWLLMAWRAIGVTDFPSSFFCGYIGVTDDMTTGNAARAVFLDKGNRDDLTVPLGCPPWFWYEVARLLVRIYLLLFDWFSCISSSFTFLVHFHWFNLVNIKKKAEKLVHHTTLVYPGVHTILSKRGALLN